ncbi:MAG: succinyl-diaminopimelate desuccinylase [Gammaproteobacteria bacterium]|nr:MAG: succinyl-diaminopimelate desuccinylase [Gammaproteobacteria bacterium]
MHPAIELAQALIRRPSVTPEDAGCMDLIVERLAPLGFRAEFMDFGEVRNLWLRYGETGPLYCYAGHTDVVPTGPETEWRHPPFDAVIEDGRLYGRGAADMKGSIASFVVAVEGLFREGWRPQGSIALLLTSDEEGPAVNGTVKVVETLQARNEHIDWCLVGEPSSSQQVGDVIKNGRRGSLGARLVVHGRQGHVAYPQLADNPIHRFAPAMAELVATEWDQGNDFFPPTTFQISNIHAGTGATNVIPGSLDVLFNFRFSTETTDSELRRKVESILDRHDLNYEVEWSLSGQPFLTPAGELVEAARAAIAEVTGIDTELSTSGGTSDGRFIAPTGAQVLELGPLNATIHQVDEHVAVDELVTLTEIHRRMLQRLLSPAQVP